MNEFKIISIEEFDADFVQNIRVKKQQPKPAPQSFIPEMIKPEVKPSEPATPVAPVVPQFIPTPTDTPAEPEPIPEKEPENPARYFKNPDPADDEISEDIYEPDIPIVEKKKKNGGLLAGKIICIILLCATVVTFILGGITACFINKGIDINGVRFNSQLRTISVGKDTIKEGALIISEEIAPDEYAANLNKPIAVSVEGKVKEGCDIMYIYSSKDVSVDNATVEVYDPITNQISERLYSHSEIFGVVTHYIPLAGLLLSFAVNNAILVCALFVLLIAFWCMILVLIQKNKKHK